jgi:hypothetical protein
MEKEVEIRTVTQAQSLAHYWAVIAMQRHHRTIVELEQQGELSEEGPYIAVSEFLYWARVVDEGFEIILGSPYTRARTASEEGRHVEAVSLLRNKTAHSLVCVVAQTHDRLGVDFVLNQSPLGEYLRWVTVEELHDQAMGYRPDLERESLYSKLLAGRSVRPGIDACWKWLSEVRYDYRDPSWAKSWVARHRELESPPM